MSNRLIPRTRETATYYYDFDEPTPEELADPTKKFNWKLFKVISDQIDELEEAIRNTAKSHTLTYAEGKNLDLWAEFYRVSRLYGFNDALFREWIRFEILRRRCTGTPDALKVLAAAFLSLLNGQTVPWSAAARVMAFPDPLDILLDTDTLQKLQSWSTLKAIKIALTPPHYIPLDEPDYIGLEIPHHLVVTPGWMQDGFGFIEDDAGEPGNDPNAESYWFAPDNKSGWEAGIWDGHEALSDLCEILWEAGAPRYVDVIVTGFDFADDNEGNPGNDSNQESYWFVPDSVNGFEAGRWPGSVLESGGVFLNPTWKLWQRPGWKLGRGDRRFLIDEITTATDDGTGEGY